MMQVEISADGVTLTGDLYPRDEAPLVIFSHGGGQTRYSWRGACERVWQRGYATLSLDLRGHGESGWASPQGYRIRNFGRDINAAARHCGTGQPVIAVGASMGGMASLLSTAELDSPVDSVVMVDFVPRIVPQGGERIRSFMLAHPEGFASLEEAALAIAEYRGKPPSGNLEGLSKNLRFREDGRWHWHWDPTFLREMEGHEDRTEIIEHAARQWRGPLLLVHGLNSDVVDFAGVAALRALAPQMEYVDVAGAGHMVVNDRNDAFIDAILAFVSRHFATVPTEP
jgi:pimeloyl-ACP methyl ester carboxylesterase